MPQGVEGVVEARGAGAMATVRGRQDGFCVESRLPVWLQLHGAPRHAIAAAATEGMVEVVEVEVEGGG